MTTRRRCKTWEIWLWAFVVTFGLGIFVGGWYTVYQVWISK